MFYGRTEELSILEKRFDSDRFEFGFVYGQRRIGKTTLIDAFGKSHKTLMFFASDSDDASIRMDFSNQLFDYLGLSGFSAFTSWDAFFLAIKSHFGNEKMMIVFDEYPNILVGHDGKRKKTDFDEKLQNAIDHVFKDTALCILIMGSNVSFMQHIIQDTKGPLYKRHTFSLFISKLKWDDALCFVEGMSLDDKVRLLSLIDTYPYYLSQIDPKKSFDENLDAFFFDRDSLISVNPAFIFSSNLGISGFYVGILRCLSQGLNTVKEIASALGAETGKVSIYLDELLKAEIVSKAFYFNSKRNTYYEINDRMVSFFFRFVHSYVDHIRLGNGKQIKAREKEAMDTFMHHAYEKLCISYLNNLNQQGKLSRFYLGFSNFKADNTSLGRSVEVDIVAAEGDSLLLGECKYSVRKKGMKDYRDLKEDSMVIPLSGYPNKEFYLFSHQGFSEDLLSTPETKLHLITSRTMMGEKD